MTTATAPTMNPTALDDHAQSLIDARLDTIERMLLGQVPRADRLAIVRDVESQIHDLLAERNADDTDRDAVIAALGRLDPPEAYLPDEAGDSPRQARPPGEYRPAQPLRVVARLADPAKQATTGRVGGIVGIMAWVFLLLAATTFAMAYREQGNIFFLVTLGLLLVVNVLGILSMILSAVARLRGPWSVAGLILGITSTIIGAPSFLMIIAGEIN